MKMPRKIESVSDKIRGRPFFIYGMSQFRTERAKQMILF